MVGGNASVEPSCVATTPTVGEFREGIDSFHDKVDRFAESQKLKRIEMTLAYREVGDTLEDVINVLEQEGLNGHTPDPPDLDGPPTRTGRSSLDNPRLEECDEQIDEGDEQIDEGHQ